MRNSTRRNGRTRPGAVAANFACLALVLGVPAAGEDAPEDGVGDWLPMSCDAVQTVGMHDYPGGDETYESSVFFESAFRLRENTLFMQHLLGEDGTPGGLYLTMATASGTETEFECRTVRGNSDNEGYSCINNPPSEILLINPTRGRFTRSAVGGWTFYGARNEQHGASLFVEYGVCTPLAPTELP